MRRMWLLLISSRIILRLRLTGAQGLRQSRAYMANALAIVVSWALGRILLSLGMFRHMYVHRSELALIDRPGASRQHGGCMPGGWAAHHNGGWRAGCPGFPNVYAADLSCILRVVAARRKCD